MFVVISFLLSFFRMKNIFDLQNSGTAENGNSIGSGYKINVSPLHLIMNPIF